MKYTKDEKCQYVKRYEEGEAVSLICKEHGIARSTFYSWLKDSKAVHDGKEISVKNFRRLENKTKRSEGIIEILQKVDCNSSSPLNIKLRELEKLYGQYSVHMLCDALQVSRGTFYNHILRNKRDNTWYAKRREEYREKIQQIYDDSNQIFGAAKIAAVLKEEGHRISVEMVRELMRDMGITSIRQGAKSLYDNEQRRYKNHLNQQFTAKRPNEIWVSDVTCFRYNQKNYFICAILDLYARAVVGFRVGTKNSTQLAKSTFKLAYENRKPDSKLLFHTDRGNNYRSNTFCSYLKQLGVTQSYSRAYVPYDNSVMESFFSNLKREELYRTKYRSEKEFRTAIDIYMEFYNERRPYTKNGYKTPSKKETEYWENHPVSSDLSD